MKLFLATLSSLVILTFYANANAQDVVLPVIAEAGKTENTQPPLDEDLSEKDSYGYSKSFGHGIVNITSSINSNNNTLIVPNLFVPTGDPNHFAPADDISAGQIKNIREDLLIMSRIFNKKIAEIEYAPFGNRSAVFWREFDIDNTAQGVYLQDYGVVFTTKVSFPLSPTPESKKELLKKTDSLWERTRKEALTPDRGKQKIHPFMVLSQRRASKYSAEMVDQFQTKIISLLKHAGNIRNLKPHDKIAVVITGKREQITHDSMYSGMMGMGMPGGPSGGMGGSMGDGFGGGGKKKQNAEEIQAAASVLTIVALKANIDKFARDKIDYDQFLKTVKVLTY